MENSMYYNTKSINFIKVLNKILIAFLVITVGLPTGGDGRDRVIGSVKGDIDPTELHPIAVVDGVKGESLGHPTILVIVDETKQLL